jgi:hypothetical protein
MSLGYRKTLMRSYMTKTKIEPLRLHCILPDTVEEAKKMIFEYVDEHPHCKSAEPSEVIKLVLKDLQRYERDHKGKCLDLRESAKSKRSAPAPAASTESDEEEVDEELLVTGTSSKKPSYAELEKQLADLKAKIQRLEHAEEEEK